MPPPTHPHTYTRTHQLCLRPQAQLWVRYTPSRRPQGKQIPRPSACLASPRCLLATARARPHGSWAPGAPSHVVGTDPGCLPKWGSHSTWDASIAWRGSNQLAAHGGHKSTFCPHESHMWCGLPCPHPPCPSVASAGSLCVTANVRQYVSCSRLRSAPLCTRGGGTTLTMQASLS